MGRVACGEGRGAVELSGWFGWLNIMLAPHLPSLHSLGSRLCYTAYSFSNLMSLCRRMRMCVCVCVSAVLWVCECECVCITRMAYM